MAAIDRETLLLYAWADLTYEGIALAMEVPVGTVRSRLNRARRALRTQLNLTLDETEKDHGRLAAAPRNA
jgi:RNA polymerase sigma-70 factor (ECF subfamily)